jgi:hypothetical protein
VRADCIAAPWPVRQLVFGVAITEEAAECDERPAPPPCFTTDVLVDCERARLVGIGSAEAEWDRVGNPASGE